MADWLIIAAYLFFGTAMATAFYTDEEPPLRRALLQLPFIIVAWPWLLLVAALKQKR